jgi:hypothetical protein
LSCCDHFRKLHEYFQFFQFTRTCHPTRVLIESATKGLA